MSDLIDRQQAIDVLRDYLVGKRCPNDGTLTCRLIENEVINKLPSAQPTFDARDTQYNLPIGTDCISRQAAIDRINGTAYAEQIKENMIFILRMLPSAQPEIIYCKDCVKHNKRIGDYVEKSDGTYDWIWKDQACPLAEFRGKAQGHEFDYQFCAYAERRTE